MKLYLSENIKSIYFFESTAYICTSTTEYPILGALSYIVHMIAQHNNSISNIAIELKNKFDLKEPINEIEEKILDSTIKSSKYKNVFDTVEHDNEYKLYSGFGDKFPQVLHIELTSTCNLNCEHCYKNSNQQKDYIEYEKLVSKIYKPLLGKTQVIHFTGGEPTLYPEFENAVNKFSMGYTLQLTTNGTNMARFPFDLYKKFQAVDISLYGLSNMEYFANTNSRNAFDMLTSSCLALAKADIPFRHTLVINEKNYEQMEAYLKYSIEVGAKSFGFATPTVSGRLINGNQSGWILSKEKRKYIYRKFRELEVKYKDKIYISPWYRSQYATVPKNEDKKPACSAGSQTWWLSENFMFRPCAFFPSEYLSLSYDEWWKFVNNKSAIDWRAAYERIEKYCSVHNIQLSDICSSFA